MVLLHHPRGLQPCPCHFAYLTTAKSVRKQSIEEAKKAWQARPIRFLPPSKKNQSVLIAKISSRKKHKKLPISKNKLPQKFHATR